MILDLDGRGPRYLQIARAIRGAALGGTLAPGTKLPGTRDLAAQLSCSRNIVVLAYEQLLLEGYLVARLRGGTFVSDAPRALPRRTGQHLRSASARLSPLGRRVVSVSDEAQAVTRHRPHTRIDFMYGLCEPDARMVTHFKRGLTAALGDPGAFRYGDPAGDADLRAQLAQRLQATRGIARTADHVVITAGAQQALDLCARLLLTPGDRVVVEDPGYEAARAAFASYGADIVPVPVDDEGLSPADAPRRGRGARLVYVTPSHQFPTGAIMTAARRRALLAWARAQNAYVIEDDYDGDLRHRGQPLRALAGADGDDRVIYCGTFAKALCPSLRLGYLSLPSALVKPAGSAKWLLDRGTSPVLQRLVATLLASGEYDRHLRRVQRQYGARRELLVSRLAEHLGSAVEVRGDEAGLHVVAWLPALDGAAIDDLVAACRTRSVGVYSIARHAVRPLARGGLILGYGALREPAIEEGVAQLAAAYHVLTRRGARRLTHGSVAT